MRARRSSAATYADLEIGLHRRDAEHYLVDLRYTLPDRDEDIRLSPGAGTVVQFDLVALRALELDPEGYGKALANNLFSPPEVRTAFAKARAGADTLGATMRIRLYIGSSAPELHALRWETLRDPDDGSPLLMGENVVFSRYLSSGDWRPVALRPQTELRALVAVAAPGDLRDYRLAPIDYAAEVGRAQSSLGEIAPTVIEGPGGATLEAIVEGLREGYDVLYLAAHGALIGGEPWLWLSNPEGKTARVAASELVTRIRELRERPRLVVLVSCQSAGEGDFPAGNDMAAIAGLGPQLAEAGVPAVVAMQGKISMETAARFLPAFFKALQKDGQIDLAVAVARGQVRDRDDHWMPLLFMRLRNGKIWYVPGFGEDGGDFEKWPTLIRSIERGQCTPVLGANLSEQLLGSQREIAQRWAETYHFPLAPHQREDLAQVAQFLAVNQSSPQFPRDELLEYLRSELLERYGDKLQGNWKRKSLDEIFAAVGAIEREAGRGDPYKTLASLPFPIYVVAATDNLLEEALTAAGKKPRTDFCRWNEYITREPSVFKDEPDYEPDEDNPLVFHLFGVNDIPDSLVLTEDDYFDYLIGATLNKELIPTMVRDALADTALLFLGFRLDEWGFRVLFRSIMSQEGRRGRRYANIAGQVMPEEGRFVEPERARRYLEGYFGDRDINISIFWGSVEDFVRELAARVNEGKR